MSDVYIPLVDSRLVMIFIRQEVHQSQEVHHPKRGENGLTALYTMFDWCVVGRMRDPRTERNMTVQHFNSINKENPGVDNFIEKLWSTESFKIISTK